MNTAEKIEYIEQTKKGVQINNKSTANGSKVFGLVVHNEMT